MSKKHTRKPAPYYPPSWFELPRTFSWGVGPVGMAVALMSRPKSGDGSR